MKLLALAFLKERLSPKPKNTIKPKKP